jgi:hypothetical protein
MTVRLRPLRGNDGARALYSSLGFSERAVFRSKELA